VRTAFVAGLDQTFVLAGTSAAITGAIVVLFVHPAATGSA
jgi:hypothetical protein